MQVVRRGVVAIMAVIAVAAVLMAAGVGSALATPVIPTQDPFYSYAGSLSGSAPGAVLRTRTVAFDASGLSVPISTTQVLYRTTDELGNPTVAVATVIQPLLGTSTKIVSYQFAYDGLASNCDPSYALQGGTPTEGTNQEEQLVGSVLAAGDTVVISDYESEDNDFAAGREEGYITLDGIRAAEGLLNAPASTPVALMGYSGGAIASDWAAEQAPSYAPTLNLVGTAMGGIAVDLAHNLNYVNGSQEWSGAIPAALVGISRAFNIDLSKYLSAYGLQVADAVGSSCLESDLGGYPGLTYQKLLKPQYTNIDQIPPFVNALNTLIMGTAGTPQEPLFMGVGNADGTGDDVMVDADDEALATEYCKRGVTVQFELYNQANHETAAIAFLPAAIAWVLARLDANVPADNGCSKIPAGDSLAPLTAASAPATAPSSTKTATLQTLQLGSPGIQTHSVTLHVRAQKATLKNVIVALFNAKGKTLASRRVTAIKGKLLTVTLTSRTALVAGRYLISARASRKLLGRERFSLAGRPNPLRARI